MSNMVHRSGLRPVLVLPGLLFVACQSLADITYKVTPLPAQEKMQIEMIMGTKSPTTTLQMPNWAPGSYRLVNNYSRVSDLKATASNGQAIEAPTKPNDYTWVFKTPVDAVTFTYTVPMQVSAGATHYSGPSTYLYVVDRKTEKCKLELVLPEGWEGITGLDAGTGEDTYIAPDYDVLADNPVTMGDYILDKYMSRGKPHYIVLRGAARQDVDRGYLLRACKHVTEAQADFFGGLPYNKYVWHFATNDSADGAGGLEHLSSTQISLASGVGPRAVGVISHEFFHLWNVKRIRSVPLGPFDYTVLPKTGALWWLEGVTDYYAHLLLHRYGWWDEKTLLDDVIGQVRGVRANARRMEVSPHDASMRVGEAANGRGNSQGFGVSYYNTGFLVGLCLDIEIRYQTGGRRSLDDVMLALWEQNKDNKPGFAEDEIRKQCVRFGGQALGPFYDKVVMQPGELPVEAQLAKVGLKLAQGPQTYTRLGFGWRAQRPTQDNLEGGAVVRGVENDGPAKDALKNGDRIVAINGKNVALSTNKDISLAVDAELDKAKPGQPIKLKIKRGTETLDVEVVPVSGTRENVWQITPIAGDSKAAELRSNWYFSGKKKIPTK